MRRLDVRGNGETRRRHQIPTAVRNDHFQKKIRVTVLRDGRAQRVELTPQQWSGRGVLGCSVLPLTSSQVV